MSTGFEQVELNYVVPQNFYMIIERSPTTQYNLQQLTIPSITGGEVDLANRFNPGKTFIPGNSLDYGTLDTTFLIDKGFKSYREILEWLKAINHPDSHDSYKEWARSPGVSTVQDNDFAKTMTTINVFATDAAMDPVAEWVFYNAFPISLDGPQYDSMATEADYLQSTASFRFTHFEHFVYENGQRSKTKI